VHATLARRHRQRVLNVDDSGDVVDGVAVDREARQAGGAGQLGDIGGAGVRAQGRDVGARGHHVLRGQVTQAERADEALRGLELQDASPGGVPG
jgi:hypothetical protein